MRVLILMSLLIFCGAVAAETAFIEATQDNTLYQSDEGNVSNGAGDYFFAGRTSGVKLRRGLIAFKSLGTIPSGATIKSVKLHLWVSRDENIPSTVNLLRVPTDWGEAGSDAPGSEGQGAPAQPGDATWIYRFAASQSWASPGGDFAEVPSASVMVDGPGAYTLGSTSTLVANVQDWLDNPSTNFGWILIAGEEANTAKRFNSRTNPDEDTVPVLEVEYSATGSLFDFSGPWFDPELDGEGYLVYETPFGWLIYYFGYSDDGERLWLVSEIVTLEQLFFGVPFELPMLVGEPGTFGMPTPSSKLTPWGTLTVIFYSCTDGLFALDGTDGDKESNVIKLTGVEDTSCLEL
jgi:hypothetical protein